MAKRKKKSRRKSKRKKKKINLKFKKEFGAFRPEYSSGGAAGLDIFSNETLILKSGHRRAVKTGIYLEIPENHVGIIKDRSGLSLKEGLKTMAGVIDSDYRGEVKILCVNMGSKDIKIRRGMKIAQILIQKIEPVNLKEVKDLSETERGENGFGSTGKLKKRIERIKKEISK